MSSSSKVFHTCLPLLNLLFASTSECANRSGLHKSSINVFLFTSLPLKLQLRGPSNHFRYDSSEVCHVHYSQRRPYPNLNPNFNPSPSPNPNPNPHPNPNPDPNPNFNSNPNSNPNPNPNPNPNLRRTTFNIDSNGVVTCTSWGRFKSRGRDLINTKVV